jgi:cell division transport system ATP-binding protein
LIELRRVWFEREGRQILSDVSFEVDRGEFVYLTGTTGAGKTTALRLMLFEDRPTRGAVFVGEYDSETISERDLPRLRRRVGAVLQDLKLLRDRTVFENVAFALEVTGTGRREAKRRSLTLLSSVELMHKRDDYPDSLSAGERQCVAIARALANDPFVLLADEPTANMDPESTDRVFGVLAAANARGTAVVIGTHDTALVARHPKRCLVLEGGRLQPAS